MENNSSVPTGTNQIAEGQSVEVPAPMPTHPIAQAVVPESDPMNTVTQTQTIVPEKPKKKFSCLKWCLILFVLLLLMLACCGIAVFTAPSWLVPYLKSSTTVQDFDKADYSHLTSDSVSKTDSNPLQDKISKLQAGNPNSPFTVSVTEEELLSAIYANNADLKDLADGTYLQFKDGNKISLRIELSSVLKSSNASNLNADDFKDIYLGVDLVISEDGKKVTIEKVTTGNSVADNLVGTDLKDKIQSEIDKNLDEFYTQNESDQKYVLKLIKITNGKMSITYAPA